MPGDWSSDVCSSDLEATARVADILVGDIGWQKLACADTVSTSRVQQQGATARVLETGLSL